MASAEGQQHPLGIYYKIWILLFVVSFFSYMVDYLNFQGMTRWGLILLFMFVKAGYIVAIFMHMRWERLALKFAILLLYFNIGAPLSHGFFHDNVTAFNCRFVTLGGFGLSG
jgi:cytochrome c oxidase subunit IV